MTKSHRRGADAAISNDPQPYDGPIARADGRRPYNRYLWPTECWAANHTAALHHLPYTWRVEVVHLADGRWATGGHVSEIERDQTYEGARCCFSSREAAVRAQAARMIRLARLWRGSLDYFGRVQLGDADARAIIAWALTVAEAEGGRRAPMLQAAEEAKCAALLAQATAEARARELARLAALPLQAELFA